MALDTQPLSRGRRVLMLVVLLALLGGSLGFAQWLVVRRQAKPFVTADLERFGFTGEVRDESSYEIKGRTGVVDGRPRRVDVFAYEVQATGGGDADVEASMEEARGLYAEIMGEPPEDVKVAKLGGRNGVEATGATEEGRFGWVRFAIMDGHAAAICYSGVGKFTDADRKVFEEICVSGVKFVGSPGQGSL